jgi:hypothetical protein
MNFKQLQSEMNVLPMMKEVADNFDDFYLDTYRQDQIYCQSETMSINLIKGVVDDEQTHFDDSHTVKKTDQYYNYDNCRQFLNWFEKTYDEEIYRVAIVHLGSEQQVYPHIDGGKYYEDKNRYHMVLSGYYDFTVNEETQRFNAGELWWFDNKAMHHVKNATPIPRICMIFDAKGK